MLNQLLSIISPGPTFDLPNFVGFQGDPVRHLFQAATISLIDESKRPLRVLEVGSWIGSSALTWGRGLAALSPMHGNLVCVDPWEPYFSGQDMVVDGVYGPMDRLSRADLSYDLFRYNIKYIDESVKVTPIRGIFESIAQILHRKYFDIIYIDGSHYYNDVKKDLHCAQALLCDGGILCGDDLELQWHECDQDHAIANCNRDCVEDPGRGLGYHPGVTRAVGEFFQGPVTVYQGFWLMRKVSEAFEPVSLSGQRTILPSHFPYELQMKCRVEHLDSGLGELLEEDSVTLPARKLGEWIISASRNEEVAVWGTGTDFLRILAHARAVRPIIEGGQIHLYDGNPSPALDRLGFPISSPTELRGYEGKKIVITSQNPATISAIRKAAQEFGIDDSRLIDSFSITEAS